MLVFGLIVTWMQKWPLFSFLQGSSTNWLLVSFALFVGISAFIGPLGLITPALTAALDDKVVNRFRVMEMVILVVIIVLMVMKPF